MGERLLTREEVEEINEGKTPLMYMEYYKGKLEWEEGYDYIFVYSTGSFIDKRLKEDI